MSRAGPGAWPNQDIGALRGESGSGPVLRWFGPVRSARNLQLARRGRLV